MTEEKPHAKVTTHSQRYKAQASSHLFRQCTYSCQNSHLRQELESAGEPPGQTRLVDESLVGQRAFTPNLLMKPLHLWR